MTFDRFGSESVEGTFASDMERARGYKPITEEELNKAYSQYNAVGAKFGIVKKTDSDTALYNKAKKYVLDWWKKEKTDAALLDKPSASGSGFTPVAGGSGTIAGNGVAGGSGGGSYIGGMPDTAVGSGGPSGVLPSVDVRAAQLQYGITDPTNAGYVNASPRPASAPAVPLTATQVSATLKSMGAPATWNPPAYARQSAEALKSWVQRAATNAQVTLVARAQTPVFTDAYVARAMRNLGITGITARSVPLAYRRSPRTLTNYLLARAAAAKLAAQRRPSGFRETSY